MPQEATLEAPATATPPKPAPVEKTPEQKQRINNFYEKMLGTTMEKAEKAAKDVAAFEADSVNRNIPKIVTEESIAAEAAAKAAADAEKAKERKPGESAPAADDAAAKEAAAKEAADKAAAEAAKGKKRVRKQPAATVQPVVVDDERIARVAADAATKAVQAQQPKPEQRQEPQQKLSVADQRKLATLQELERIQPDKKGIAQAFTEALKAREDYEKAWRKENPGKQFDDGDEEHNAFFEEQESKLNYTDDDYEAANEARIRREAREEVTKEQRGKETEQERRLRMVEERDNLKAAETESEAQLLAFAEVPKLEEADTITKPVLERAIQHSRAFAKTAYSLVNGLVAEDPKNQLHQQVSAVTTSLLTHFGAMPVAETANEQGQTYVTPWDFAAMTPQQQAQHWTITAIDVIEFQNNTIAKNVKAAVAQKQAEFEDYAKKMGVTIPSKAAKPPTPPPNPTPAHQASVRKTNAPTIGSEVTPAVQPSGKKEEPLKGRALWLSKVLSK